ncbi:MAG: DUF6175 family protein [Spirochaetes bacterium]|nr:DUF6175 family protein [Spirochaetota bacterium]
MIKKTAAIVALAAFLLASCASAPASRPAGKNTTGPNAEQPGTAAGTQPNPEKDRAKELITGTPPSSGTAAASPSGSTASATTPPAAAAPASTDVPPPAPGQMTPDEQAFLERYLAGLQYMVYYDEEAGVSRSVAKTAVTQANRYLIEKMGMTVVDFDQIEKNRKDQEKAYQNETGGSIDIIQYLAQKFNADVYVEISFNIDEKVDAGKFYSTAKGTLKIFDPSTAQLLGSVSFQSAQAFSQVSQDAATQNAVASSVWTVMPKMTDQAKALIRNSLSNGIRYEVLLQSTADARAVSTFRRQLAKKVRLVEQSSYSPAETKLYVFTFQQKTFVEDAIYDAAERGGFPDIYLVYQRGKSFTFHTGM